MGAKPRFLLSFFLLLVTVMSVHAQQITGVYKGRIKGHKVELKLVRNGDSLTGTAYYFETASSYTRYQVKGYQDARDNSVVWWDAALIEERGTRLFGKTQPFLSIVEINCPGDGSMVLFGKAGPRDDPDRNGGAVGLTKAGDPQFRDEWDYVIDNYTVGANDPELIDSISRVALSGPQPEPQVIAQAPPAPREQRTIIIPETPKPKQAPKIEPPVAVQKPAPPVTVEEKFLRREKKLHAEIPIAGDSVELRFYDNAEIDGDSISLFLNDKLLFTHVRLSDKAYSIKLAVADITDSADLTMVAENLGSIPPNTSYMVVIVEGKRHEAFLASTENSSAVIRLRRKE